MTVRNLCPGPASEHVQHYRSSVTLTEKINLFLAPASSCCAQQSQKSEPQRLKSPCPLWSLALKVLTEQLHLFAHQEKRLSNHLEFSALMSNFLGLQKVRLSLGSPKILSLPPSALPQPGAQHESRQRTKDHKVTGARDRNNIPGAVFRGSLLHVLHFV